LSRRGDRREADFAALAIAKDSSLETHSSPAGARRTHEAIAGKRRELIALCLRYGVARLEVFGAAARGVDFDVGASDADFLVEFQPGSARFPLEQFFGLADALERLLGHPVDLVEAGAIRNPFILAGINRSREVVYAS
jgi:predicted nucleotidyltransferase